MSFESGIGVRVWNWVDEDERTVGGGGERNQVVSVAFAKRWVVNERGGERKSSRDWSGIGIRVERRRERRR